MHVKEYMKHIKNEIMTAGQYCCAAKDYKSEGKTEQAQLMHKMATDGMGRVEMLMKMLDACVVEKEKEYGPKVYKDLYEECIEILKDEHKEVESKIKQG